MIEVQVHASIQNLGSAKWDQVAHPDFPFSHYHFLRALETSGCLGQRTGWQPRFVGAVRGEALLGALVQYERSNSYGEYIFDFAWAQAAIRAGFPYYPKLTSAIPFTPATGPKLLLNPTLHESERTQVAAMLLAASDEWARAAGVTSAHALFIPDAQAEDYRQAGYFLRHSFQYHWKNHDYRDMGDFLSRLRSKRRKEILRERDQVAASGVRITRLTGDALTADHADVFYEFYLSTIDKRGSYDYLTAEFFRETFTSMKANILLTLAYDGEKPVAGALAYFGAETLYGRNWGCLADYRALHFELCYYQGLEFAIERKLRKFEAGAQGEHKFQRGFLPTLTYSAHRIRNPDLDKAVRDHVELEKAEIAELFERYQEHTPYARDSEQETHASK